MSTFPLGWLGSCNRELEKGATMPDDMRQGRHAAPEGKIRGRHRAPDPASSPLNITPLTAATPRVGERRAAMDLERKLVKDASTPQQRATAVAATTGLIMISSMSGAVANAAVSETSAPPATGSNSLVLAAEDPIIAADDVVLTRPKVAVETTAAPPPPPPPPAPPAPPAPEVKRAAPRHAAPAPTTARAAPVPKVVAPVPRVATPAPAPSATGKGAIIANAALAQLGRTQDCTMLVTNALKAVGISHRGWPISYFALGSQVSAAQAQPGDLVYYANGGAGVAHIGVYIGNDMAVHGGWNGNQTVTFSVNVGSGPVFIRVA